MGFSPPKDPFKLFDVVTAEEYQKDDTNADHKLDKITGRMIPCSDGTETHRKL